MEEKKQKQIEIEKIQGAIEAKFKTFRDRDGIEVNRNLSIGPAHAIAGVFYDLGINDADIAEKMDVIDPDYLDTNLPQIDIQGHIEYRGKILTITHLYRLSQEEDAAFLDVQDQDIHFRAFNEKMVLNLGKRRKQRTWTYVELKDAGFRKQYEKCIDSLRA